jgi:hypothetical protein
MMIGRGRRPAADSESGRPAPPRARPGSAIGTAQAGAQSQAAGQFQASLDSSLVTGDSGRASLSDRPPYGTAGWSIRPGPLSSHVADLYCFFSKGQLRNGLSAIASASFEKGPDFAARPDPSGIAYAGQWKQAEFSLLSLFSFWSADGVKCALLNTLPCRHLCSFQNEEIYQFITTRRHLSIFR